MLARALCYHCEFKHSNSIYSINMFVKLAVLACVATVAFGQWAGHNNGGWNGNQNALDSGAYTGDGDYHGEGLQEAGAFGDVSQNWNDNNGQWNGNQGNQWNGNQGNQWNAAPQQQAWNGGNQWNAAPQQAWNGAPQQPAWNAGHSGQPGLLPAGVDASSCPNYPYCH